MSAIAIARRCRLKLVCSETNVELSRCVVLLVGIECVSFSVLGPETPQFKREPVLEIKNVHFAQALMDIYLGRQPLLPEAKSIWAESAARLLSFS